MPPSDYIEFEAQESDDEDSFGFMGRRKDNEEEDTTLEGYRGGGGGAGCITLICGYVTRFLKIFPFICLIN